MKNSKHFNSLIDADDYQYVEGERWYDRIVDYGILILIGFSVGAVIVEIIY